MTTDRREFLKLSGGSAVTVGTGMTAGCMGVLGANQSERIKVASKRYAENILLSYMAIESLRANTDLTVLDETGFGGSVMNFRALTNNEVGMYWMYTGTAWSTIPPKKDRVIADQEKLYQAVQRQMQRQHGLTYLDRAPFNNTYILIATPEWVENTGVKTMTDFADYVNNGNTDFTLAMGPEFLSRPDGWSGLAKHYGFNDALSSLSVRTVSASLAYQIIGTTGANVGVGYSTNPNIRRYGLKTIDDNKSFFPPYNPVPAVNSAIESYPEMREPLNAIGPTLTTEKIMRLNGLVSLQNRDPQDVAREHLRSEGLL